MTALFDRIPQGIFRLLAWVVIGVLLIMILFPLYFMVTTSFKFEGEIYSELTWIPRNPTLSNFRDVIVNFGIPLYLRNTLIVALITTSIVVVISVLAAYALTRLRFPGRALMARFRPPAAASLVPQAPHPARPAGFFMVCRACLTV